MIVTAEDGEDLDAAEFCIVGIDHMVERRPIAIVAADAARLMLENDGGFLRGGEIFSEPCELLIIHAADAGQMPGSAFAMDGIPIAFVIGNHLALLVDVVIAIDDHEVEWPGIEGVIAMGNLPCLEQILLVLEIAVVVSDDVVFGTGKAIPLVQKSAAGIEAAFGAAEVPALDDEIRLAGDGGIDEEAQAGLLVLAMSAVMDIGDEAETKWRGFSGGRTGLVFRMNRTGGFGGGEGGKCHEGTAGVHGRERFGRKNETNGSSRWTGTGGLIFQLLYARGGVS